MSWIADRFLFGIILSLSPAGARDKRREVDNDNKICT